MKIHPDMGLIKVLPNIKEEENEPYDSIGY
jgi:hypothetical protein